MNSVEKSHQMVIECITSFHIAMHQAGGAILSAGRIEKMSAMDFLLLIAPNGIKFVCEKSKNYSYNQDDYDDVQG